VKTALHYGSNRTAEPLLEEAPATCATQMPCRLHPSAALGANEIANAIANLHDQGGGTDGCVSRELFLASSQSFAIESLQIKIEYE
jgi:hypothetical protein